MLRAVTSAISLLIIDDNPGSLGLHTSGSVLGSGTGIPPFAAWYFGKSIHTSARTIVLRLARVLNAGISCIIPSIPACKFQSTSVNALATAERPLGTPAHSHRRRCGSLIGETGQAR